jgi:hypothetical protein
MWLAVAELARRRDALALGWGQRVGSASGLVSAERLVARDRVSKPQLGAMAVSIRNAADALAATDLGRGGVGPRLTAD